MSLSLIWIPTKGLKVTIQYVSNYILSTYIFAYIWSVPIQPIDSRYFTKTDFEKGVTLKKAQEEKKCDMSVSQKRLITDCKSSNSIFPFPARLILSKSITN